jgi:hypothetical protein
MAEATLSIPITVTVGILDNYLTVKVQESTLTVKIEGRETQDHGRLKLEPGKTLFDIVLDSAKILVTEFRASEFSAAELYHVAVDRYPELNLRRNSWSSHVVSSAPNHPSYDHYTARRRYFRYLGRGRYSLDPSIALRDGRLSVT